MDGLEIRPLTESDIDSVYSVEREVYDSPWERKLLSDSLKAPMTYSVGFFKNSHCFGYAIYQVVFSEGHLLNLAIPLEVQGRGYGGGLLEEVLKDSRRRGALSFFLEVRPSNKIARKMYEGRGFKSLMTREHYYPDGEAALIMILDLMGGQTS